MPARKHAHRVHRRKMGDSYVIYRCVDDCTSYFTPDAMLGQTVRCYACRNEFTFTKRNLRQVTPRCDDPKCAMPKSPTAKAAYAGLPTATKSREEVEVREDTADAILRKLGL